MKIYANHVGIDISKLKLDVYLLEDISTNKSEHFIVMNNEEGIKSMIKKLKSKKIDLTKVLFCFEHTGVYTCPLAIYLAKYGLNFWLVPAIEIKRSKGISRGKSDKVDAKDIAWYSVRNIDKLSLSKMPEKEIQQLKLLFSEREKVVKSLLIFTSTSENKHFMDKQVYKEVRDFNEKTIKQLKASKIAIEKRMYAIVNSSPEIKQQYNLIISVPGVGLQSALYFIIVTKGFTAFSNSRKFACYAGTAPFEYSSGSSIRGATKVNHMADKKMKSLLQMSALSAIRHDNQIKTYYKKKQGEGKNNMLILNNIRCKIIDRVFCVVKRKTPFVNTCAFAS